MSERWNELRERLLDYGLCLTTMMLSAAFLGLWLLLQIATEKLIEYFHPVKPSMVIVVWTMGGCEALSTLALGLTFLFQDLKKSYKKVKG